MKQYLLTGLLIGASALTGVQGAQSPGAQSGQNIFTCETTVLSLDEGHSLAAFKGKGLQITLASSPDHMSHIDCLGTVESMPDKTFKASGYCLHTSREGDKWIDRWWNDSTMKTGRWEETGVSGKWRGSHSTGTFVYTDASTESTCKGVSNWEVDR
jgi:hypothetical protein